ncbi:restriction endonuclease subunit S [Cytophagaceae bacterium ABcell3]|nr:restriction endonuclease subunit S [Cytophagaceae bacterium ABcell3]
MDIAVVNPTRPRPKFDPDKLVPYVGLPQTDEHSHEIVEVVMRPYKEVAGRSVIYPNDILFARIEPSVFNKKYIEAKDLHGHSFAFTSTEFYVVETPSIDPQYLFFMFLTDYVYNQVKGKTTGSTGRRRLDPDVFAKLLIPVPSENIIYDVVNIINDARALKSKKLLEAKSLIDGIDKYLLKELGIVLPEKDVSIEARMFTTSFQKVSGKRFDPKLFDTHSQNLFKSIEKSKFPKSPLKQLLIQSIAGDWGLDENSTVKEDDYSKCLVIRATEFDNLYNLKLENDRVKFRLIKNDKLKKLDIQSNDLLIEKSGGSPDQPVGRIALLTEDICSNNTICFSNFIHKIRVDESKVSPEYLFCFLKTIHNIKITEIMQSQTNGIRNLIMGEYLGQSIVLPPIEKQIEIGLEANRRRYEAQRLAQEANAVLENVRLQVEEMILKP